MLFVGLSFYFVNHTVCVLLIKKKTVGLKIFILSSQSEYDEFISSGLYLVVLLHFCEQRFSDVLGAVDAAGVRTQTCTHSDTH